MVSVVETVSGPKQINGVRYVSEVDKVIGDEREEKPKPGISRGEMPKKMAIERDSDDAYEEVDDDAEDDSDWDFGKNVKGNKSNPSGSVVAVRKRDKGIFTLGYNTKVMNNATTNKKDVVVNVEVAKRCNTTTKSKWRKLIDDMLAPAEEEEAGSPAQKVRRMSSSPFHKRSGSLLSRLGEEGESEGGRAPPPLSLTHVAARPKRANRTVAQYDITDDDDAEEGRGSDDD